MANIIKLGLTALVVYLIASWFGLIGVAQNLGTAAQISSMELAARTDARACYTHTGAACSGGADGDFIYRGRAAPTTAPYAAPTSPPSPTTAPGTSGTGGTGTTGGTTGGYVMSMDETTLTKTLVKDTAEQGRTTCEKRDAGKFVCKARPAVTVTHPGGNIQLDYSMSLPAPTNVGSCTVTAVGDARQVVCATAGLTFQADEWTYKP